MSHYPLLALKDFRNFKCLMYYCVKNINTQIILELNEDVSLMSLTSLEMTKLTAVYIIGQTTNTTRHFMKFTSSIHRN